MKFSRILIAPPFFLSSLISFQINCNHKKTKKKKLHKHEKAQRLTIKHKKNSQEQNKYEEKKLIICFFTINYYYSLLFIWFEKSQKKENYYKFKYDKWPNIQQIFMDFYKYSRNYKHN